MVSKPKSNASILNILTKFFAGFLGSVMTFIILLKFSNAYWGIVVGILLSIGIGIYLLKYKQHYKIVAYGVLGSAVFIILAVIAISIFVYSAFQGIAG